MVYKKACDEMKEIKEAMQSVINEIGYWVFLFVLLFVPWILKLIRFIKHYPSHSILFDSNDVFVLISQAKWIPPMWQKFSVHPHTSAAQPSIAVFPE